MIRQSVREMVEGVLGDVSGSTESRQDIRAVGERLGTALIVYVEAAEPSGSAPRAPASVPDPGSPGVGGPDERARAFRVMAGIASPPFRRRR
jgi:hypothetical protein